MKTTRREILKGLLASGAILAVAPHLLTSEHWHQWPILNVEAFDMGRSWGVLFGYREEPNKLEAIRFPRKRVYDSEGIQTFLDVDKFNDRVVGQPIEMVLKELEAE